MLELHSPGIDSIVTVTLFEASLDWVYSKNEKTGQLAPLKRIIYTQDIARRSDLFMIDNAVVSFTYNSWQQSAGITPWPYLGRNIIGVEQYHLNAHYNIDINTPDDAEWLEFIKQFPKWREQRS
jgi:hypothetical protein